MITPFVAERLSRFVFATANQHKIDEVNAQVGNDVHFRSLVQLGCIEALPESTGTISGNAMQKALYVHEKYYVDCFAEDSGLEIDALDGRPGVDTAHYSGTRDNELNMAKVLIEMKHLGDFQTRKARFRTVIALVTDMDVKTFEGSVEGKIAFAKTGGGGFGYDPIFIPDGYEQTFAELPETVKIKISHRARAVEKLLDWAKDAYSEQTAISELFFGRPYNE